MQVSCSPGSAEIEIGSLCGCSWSKLTLFFFLVCISLQGTSSELSFSGRLFKAILEVGKFLPLSSIACIASGTISRFFQQCMFACLSRYSSQTPLQAWNVVLPSIYFSNIVKPWMYIYVWFSYFDSYEWSPDNFSYSTLKAWGAL